MTIDGHRIGVQAFPKSEWEYAVGRDLVDQIHIAMAAPFERGQYFVHQGKQYFRANDGNVYRRVDG